MSASRYLFITGMGAFIVIGALQAAYGPAFSAFQARFGVSPAQVSLVVSLHFLGSVIAILLMGFLLERFSYRQLLSTAALLLTAGCTIIVLSSSWWLTVAGAALAGLGFGSFNIGFNTLFVQSFSRAAAAVNLISAAFGVGAVLAPILVGLMIGRSVGLAFLPFAIASAVIFFLLLKLELPAKKQGAQETRSSAAGLWSLAGFILLYFVYVGTEVGTASWQATHLGPVYGEQRAAFLTSAFWAALTLGRFIVVPLSLYLRPPLLVLGGCSLAMLSLGMSHVTQLAPYSYTLTGFFLAPVFPTALVWLQQVFPRRAAQATSFVLASASFGAVVLPPFVGVVVELNSPAVIPTVLTGFAFSCVAIASLLWRRSSEPR